MQRPCVKKGGKQATLIIAGNRLVKSRHLGLSAVPEPYLAVFVILQVARNFPRRTVTTFQSSIVHSVQFTILWAATYKKTLTVKLA